MNSIIILLLCIQSAKKLLLPIFFLLLSHYTIYLKCKKNSLFLFKTIMTNKSNKKYLPISRTKLNEFFSQEKNNNFTI